MILRWGSRPFCLTLLFELPATNLCPSKDGLLLDFLQHAVRSSPGIPLYLRQILDTTHQVKGAQGLPDLLRPR